MGWELTRWIVSLRSVQLMGSFIPGALNGWLLYFIDHKGIPLDESIIILQILITLLFSYTVLSLLVMHGYRFAQRPVWMTGSVCFDIVFCFLAVAIITILGVAGVPANCSGLSRSLNITSIDQDDREGLKRNGFNTMGFTDNNEGTLDQYCGMEKAFYFITLAIILSLIFTIILSVIRVCQMRMYSKEELDDLLQERENMIKLEHKLQDQEALSTPTPSQSMSPVAPQANDGFSANNNTRPSSLSRPMSRTTYHATPSSSSRPTRPGLRYAAVDSIPGPSSSPSSSSYRGRGQQQHPHPHPNEPVSPLSPDSPIPSGSSIAPLPHDRGFILSPTDVSANLAMVADGSRGYTPGGGGGSHHQGAVGVAVELPPYSPGNNMRATMHGHAGESNDIRLSEYVKGATAAQDMKDSNGF